MLTELVSTVCLCLPGCLCGSTPGKAQPSHRGAAPADGAARLWISSTGLLGFIFEQQQLSTPQLKGKIAFLFLNTHVYMYTWILFLNHVLFLKLIEKQKLL